MRGPLSSATRVDFVVRAFRTSPSPSASVDLAHLRPVRGRIGCATRSTSSEPEADGEDSLPLGRRIRSGSRRDVIRSTIYSGSPGHPNVANKPESKGCHHSYSRSSAMWPRSWCPTGSSTWLSRPPADERSTPQVCLRLSDFAKPPRRPPSHSFILS
jgi:hypothetical protein